MTRRNIVKCQCCNKRKKKIVSYECWTEDCEEHAMEGEFTEVTYPMLKYRWHETYLDYLRYYSQVELEDED